MQTRIPHLLRAVGFLAVVTFCFCPSRVAAADCDIVGEFITATPALSILPGINAANFSSCCEWTGYIRCDSDRRVTHITFNNFREDSIPGIYGTIPPSMANLTALIKLELPRRLYGPFPQGIWRLPNIEAIELAFGGLNGTIPSDLSPSLRNISIKAQDFYGTIPKEIALLPNLAILELEACKFTCPLPIELYRLVSHRLPNQIISLHGNDFSFSNGRVCGDFLPQEANTRIFPLSTPHPPTPGPGPEATKLHVFESVNFQVELVGNNVFIFAAKTFPSGARYVYREEHLLGQPQAISYTTVPTRGSSFKNITQYSLNEFSRQSRQVEPLVYAVDTFMANSANWTTIIDLKDPNKVKFSYKLTNLNPPAYTSLPGKSANLELAYKWALKSAHSVVDTPTCKRVDFGVLSTSECNSTTLSYNINFAEAGIAPSVRFSAATTRVNFTLGFPLNYNIDEDFQTLRFLKSDTSKTVLSPVGSDSSLISLFRAGIRLPTPFSTSDQYIALIGRFSSNEIPAMSFFYDPDVSITLLFDVPTPPSIATPETIALNQQINVGAAVGITLAAIALVGFIALVLVYAPLRNRLMPFLAKKDEALKESIKDRDTLDDAADHGPDHGWKASKPSRG